MTHGKIDEHRDVRNVREESIARSVQRFRPDPDCCGNVRATLARKQEQEIQEMLDASQEVAREAIASVLRVAKERKIDPQRLLRVSFQSLGAMSWTMASPPQPPPRKPPPRKRSAKKPS